MTIVHPRQPDKTRLWSQEVQIADRDYRKKKEIAYIFNNGMRVYDDKVSKDGYE